MYSSFKGKMGAFEKAISTMQTDLQRLANKGNVSDRFIAKQNRILKHLIDYYNESQHLIKSTQGQLIETQIANNRQREEFTDRIIQFEAIYILHGILDFPLFLDYPKDILTDWAVDLYKDEKGFMLTHMMKDYIKELPETDQKVVEAILFRRVDQKIKELLSRVNHSRKKQKQK